MWQKNSGKSENEILQNLFTAYLTTAVKRRRKDYIRQAVRLQQMEDVTGNLQNYPQYSTQKDIFFDLPLSMQLEDSALFSALKEVNERERHVFFARVLDGRSFGTLAEEMGMGYKGVTSIYYRTLGKIKKKMKELRK